MAIFTVKVFGRISYDLQGDLVSALSPLWGVVHSRLALVCGLHKISKGVSMRKTDWKVIGPPANRAISGERIHALCVDQLLVSLKTDYSWNLWITEKRMGLMTGYPSLLDDEIISTPLPKSMEEYNQASLAR